MMQNNLTEKTLSRVKSLLSKTETSTDNELFQFISNSLHYSRFVKNVIDKQCDKTLEQLIWHAYHSSEDLCHHLRETLTQSFFVNSDVYSSQKVPFLSDYREKYHLQAEVMSLLRNTRYQHSAAIAILELNNALSIEESTKRMSILAEELIQFAYIWSYASQAEVFGMPSINQEIISDNNDRLNHAKSDFLPQNLLILAMGKFGGNELNFSSDIDLIFFYMSDGNTGGGRRKLENSRFFQKTGALLIKLLDENTQDGFVFRVDMRLRPYGDSGSLVMSIDQAEDYYHEQGRDWERFAMVRARIITGRAEEKQQLEEIITPFAFRRYIDYGVIDSLRNMKQMIQREVRRRGLKGNIKLGAGGIREVEFMVQSLQLIQGGRYKQLQEKNLLKVLPLLVEGKLLPEDSSQELAKSYRFLRRLEHCLQEVDEKQTQQLPNDENSQLVISTVMGFNSWEKFEQYLNQVHFNVNSHFNSLFGEERQDIPQKNDFFISLWEGYISESLLLDKVQSKYKLASDSSINPEEFINLLNDFRESTLVKSLTSKGSKRLKVFFPILLEKCIQTQKPNRTLESLLVIIKAILKRTAYLELLSENLPILQHLVDLVSQSDWVVHRLSECPILFDELLYPNSLYAPLKMTDLQSELQQSLLRIDQNDEELVLDAIRQFKQINELRIAAALLSKRLNISQVSQYLTQLAQVIIQISLNRCWQYLTTRHGCPSELKNDKTGFSVIAYGKLGGIELGFNSDLDLVFLYDQLPESQTNGKKPISANRFYTRLAQKLIHFLSTRTSSGVLYEVDMRLRPSGNSGLLVSHIDAFKTYQKENAWTWEHQALVRARRIVGDAELGQKFEQLRFEVIMTKRDQNKLRTDVVEMRKKMRQTLDKSTAKSLDLKQCVGGLVDIEFLAQYLVLSLSNKSLVEGAIPPSDTVGSIKFVSQKNLVSLDNSKYLIDVYKRYRDHLNELVITSGVSLINAKLFKEERKNVQQIWEECFE